MISEILSLIYFFCLRGVIVASIVAVVSPKMICKIALSTAQVRINKYLFRMKTSLFICFNNFFCCYITYPCLDLCNSIRSVGFVEIIIVLRFVNYYFRTFCIRDISFFSRCEKVQKRKRVN